VVCAVWAMSGCGAGRETTRTPSGEAVRSSAAHARATGQRGHGLGVAVGPWDATMVSVGDFLPGSLVSDGTYLYALTSHAIVRSDPATGRHVSVSVPRSGRIVIAGNYLWLAVGEGAATGLTLRRYALPALTSAGHDSITIGSMSGPGPVIASRDGKLLYVGSGTAVAIIDAERMQVTRRLTVPHPEISGLALSPDNKTLYVGTVPAGGTPGTVDLFNLPRANPARTKPGVLGMGPLLATRGGLWEVGWTGNARPVTFAPLRSHSTQRTKPFGGGFPVPTVTMTGNTVWIGGLPATCLDPDSGVTRAAASAHESGGSLSPVLSDVTAASDGALYAIYSSTDPPGKNGLVLLHPPNICDG
jgi:hypothetical protein